MDHELAIAALGVVLGLQHATDADHLVAVATIVSRERRFADGALVGLLWGVGHTATLAVAGAIILLAGVRLPSSLASGLEVAVGAMLVLLGIWRLRDAARGLGAVASDHLLADHAHGGREVLHSHAHAHASTVHRHPHVHPSHRLLGALGARRGRIALRPLLVGAVHGMAGTAAISLLVLATTRTAWAAALYLALFGMGTIAGMTALTAVLAFPMTIALRFDRARRTIAFAAGVVSIAFGIFYGWRAV
jgi:hypothetical protein